MDIITPEANAREFTLQPCGGGFLLHEDYGALAWNHCVVR
jgi:hypothetical protein